MKRENVVLLLLVCCFLLCVTSLHRINDVNSKLDKLHTTDTIYVDVDDMIQADWKSYTPVDSVFE